MPKQKLQLTVSQTSNQEYELFFKRGDNNIKIEGCTEDELRMIKEVILKSINNILND